MKTTIYFLFALLILPGLAYAMIPSVWGEWTWTPTEIVHITVTPEGNGMPLNAARQLDGSLIDATIRVQLWVQGDSLEDPQPPAPVPNFPAEDIWLEGDGLNICWAGAIADANTDAEGWFTFSRALTMGGSNASGGTSPTLRVMVSGSALFDENSAPIAPAVLVNSPDIDGDAAADLRDVVLFTTDFYGAYAVRSDFVWDGVLDLLDVVALAASMGEQCP
jgi:hypothetical protein